MSDTPPLYAQVRTLASKLDRAEQLRLIAEIAAGLVAEADAAPKPNARVPLPMDDNLWGGPVLIRTESTPDKALIVTHGIDAETGAYLVCIDAAGATKASVAIENLDIEKQHQSMHQERKNAGENTYGLSFEFSYEKLSEAGWAVVVADTDDARILDALEPLIRHRATQQKIDLPPFSFEPGETCGAWFRRVLGPRALAKPLDVMAKDPRLPVLIYSPQARLKAKDAPGGTCPQWLAAYGVMVGPVKPPNGVPFYLMLAGRPGPIYQNDSAYIPFSFQYDLDLFWGVGRICFTNDQGDHDYYAYRSYAEHVVAFEQDRAQNRPLPYGRQLTYFATRHDYDPATEASEEHLVVPLAGLDGRASIGARWGFTERVLRREGATRDGMGTILSGGLDGPPAVLFTASHGVALRPENPLLAARQGSLICHGWATGSPVDDKLLFSGESFDQLGKEARVEGMVALLFACYGAGCPRVDSFTFSRGMLPPIRAPYDIVARLPQRMLARGALAVLGHVDLAWNYGFARKDLGLESQPQAFSDVLGRLLNGERLGFVTDQFNALQATHATALAHKIIPAHHNPDVVLPEIGELWKAYHDTRSYILLGDPAVRLPFKEQGAVPNPTA